MVKKQRIVIDGGSELLIAEVKRGPKGSPVVQLRLFNERGPHMFVLEDVDVRELLPLLRAILPSAKTDARTLTAVDDIGGADEDPDA